MDMNNYEVKENEKILKIKDWVKINLLMMIPIINIIMCIIWLVSDKTNKNLKNFLMASLIILAIFFVVYLILAFLILSLVYFNNY